MSNRCSLYVRIEPVDRRRLLQCQCLQDSTAIYSGNNLLTWFISIIELILFIIVIVDLTCSTIHCHTLHCHTYHCHTFTLHYCTTVHCLALHCIALRCIALHCRQLHCHTLYYLTTLLGLTLHGLALHFLPLAYICLVCSWQRPVSQPSTWEEDVSNRHVDSGNSTSADDRRRWATEVSSLVLS